MSDELRIKPDMTLKEATIAIDGGNKDSRAVMGLGLFTAIAINPDFFFGQRPDGPVAAPPMILLRHIDRAGLHDDKLARLHKDVCDGVMDTTVCLVMAYPEFVSREGLHGLLAANNIREKEAAKLQALEIVDRFIVKLAESQTPGPATRRNPRKDPDGHNRK